MQWLFIDRALHHNAVRRVNHRPPDRPAVVCTDASYLDPPLITQQPAYSLTEQNRNPHQEQEREEGRGVSVEPLWLSDTVYKSISCRR